MFEFKKAMQFIMEKEDYECECCGSMDEKTGGASGCSSSCGSAINSCCGSANSSCCTPVNDSNLQKSEGASCLSSCTGNDNLNKK